NQLTFKLDSQITNVTARLSQQPVTQMALSLQANSKAADMNRVDLSDYHLEIAQQNQPLVTVSGSGQYEVRTGAADLQAVLQLGLAGLLRVFPQTNLTVSAGTAE